MKHLIYLMAFTVSLFSCGGNDGEELSSTSTSEGFPQKWVLVKMTNSFAGDPPATGEDMHWQEYYILNMDGTFLKHRQQGDEVVEAEGSYTIFTQTDGKYIELKYASETDLISSCTPQGGTDVLFVISENEVKGTWEACDGPGLFYKRAE